MISDWRGFLFNSLSFSKGFALPFLVIIVRVLIILVYNYKFSAGFLFFFLFSGGFPLPFSGDFLFFGLSKRPLRSCCLSFGGLTPRLCSGTYALRDRANLHGLLVDSPLCGRFVWLLGVYFPSIGAGKLPKTHLIA